MEILHLSDASLKKFFPCDIIRAVRKTTFKAGSRCRNVDSSLVNV